MTAFKIDASVTAEEDVGITRADLTIEKLPGMPLRGRVECYRANEEGPARVEWGPLYRLAPSLRRRHGVTVALVVHALLAQQAPEEVVREAELALEV